MNKELKDLIEKSGYLHEPLNICGGYFGERSLSGELLKQKPIKSDPAKGTFIHRDRGEMAAVQGIYSLKAPLTFDEWGNGYPPDGDYCNFGRCTLVLRPEPSDMRAYNRIRFSAYASGNGVRVPQLYIGLKNDGEIKVPDPHGRTGTHQVSLNYGEWKDCLWEIPELARDNVTEMTFSMPLNGSDGGVAGFGEVKIRNIRFETVSAPEPWQGWSCRGISCSSKYNAAGRKTAVTQLNCRSFILENMDNGSFSELPVKDMNFLGASYKLLDFTQVEAGGRYRIKAGGEVSHAFEIGRGFDDTLWLLTNFIYSERCGVPVPGKHCSCHGDIKAEHNGVTLAYNGGWHDAGDLSQQTLQTGEIASALYSAADKAGNCQLSSRLREEARWGMDFILKTRFGDGYRATSAGLTRFTDNLIGNMDDVTARVHNHALENWLLSAIECEASQYEKGRDSGLSDMLIAAAWQDYFYAAERFDAYGAELPVFFEHSYSSPISFYYAAAVLAGSKLLAACPGEPRAQRVRADIEKHLGLLLNCQQISMELPVTGYFCRDSSLSQPVHFNHQSREQVYAEALCSALNVKGLESGLKARTEKAVNSLAEYYKSLMNYASPYGMIPAGVYFTREAEDEESFKLLHLFADHKAEKRNFIKQVESGVKIAQGMYVKMFPVWFSFRGNGAVMLAQAAAARILGNHLRDGELKDIAMSQIYFILGNNPMGQSLIYGEGYRYPDMYSALLGETAGEIPVGIETDGNRDEPFFPFACNATYKEVWTSPAARFLAAL